MDTLFTLVNFSDHHHHHQQQSQQQSSFNSHSTKSGSSSRSSSVHYATDQPYYYQEQECCNKQQLFYNINNCSSNMDEDDFSSSSSHHRHFYNAPPTLPTSFGATPTPPSTGTPTPTYPSAPLFEPADFSFQPDLNVNVNFSGSSGGRWATELLVECARAIAARDTSRVQQLMWMLNELGTPYGDTEQKLASYFLQGLFARLTSGGPRTLATLASASDRAASFDSTRRTALRFQELSPWQPFGHVASNGAILEAFAEGSPTRLHILDLSTTFCTQWPTLLEAIATRSSADETPHLTITTVAPATANAIRVMKEVGSRMERFARLMGVPFQFNAVHHSSGDLSSLNLESLGVHGNTGEALAVNFVNALHGIPPSSRHRDSLLSTIRRLQPRIVTIVEEEADLESSNLDEDEAFLKGLREGIRFFSAYLDSLEESFPRTSNERLALERAAGRAVVDLVSCPAGESGERRETALSWSRRMRAVGFSPAQFSDDIADDIRALLRRYKEGWSMHNAGGEDSNDVSGAAGVFLAWKEQPVVWASAWRP